MGDLSSPSSADKPRKRISLACDNCKKRKYRCNGDRPTCGACAKSHLSCHYTPRPPSRNAAALKPKGPRALHAAYLRQRIRELESRASQLNINFKKLEDVPQRDDEDDSDSDEPMMEVGPSPSSASPEPRPTPSRNPYSAQFLPATPGSDAGGPIDPVCRCASCAAQAGQAVAGDVIPADALAELIELWFACHYHVDPLPMFHRLTFMRSLGGPNPPSELLLHAMYATAAPYSKHPVVCVGVGPVEPDARDGAVPEARGDRYAVGEMFYAKARSLVMRHIEMPDVSTVQALILISHFSTLTGRMTAAWQYLSMAVEMARTLSLDEDPDDVTPTLSIVEKDIRRRVFWVCYVQDRFLSTTVDRHFLIAGFPAIKLPMPEKLWESYYDLNDATCDTTNVEVAPLADPFSALILLADIFTRISVVNNTNVAANPMEVSLGMATDAKQHAAQISELHEALNMWHAGLAPFLAAKPNRKLLGHFVMDLSIDTNPPFFAIFLQFMYNTCRSLLHRQAMMSTIRKCHSNAKFSPHFEICDMATLENARLALDVLLPQPKVLVHMCSFMPYFVFQSCIVHIMIAQVPNLERVMHHGCFRTHMQIKLLKLLGEHSYMAKPLATTLEAVVELAHLTIDGTKERIWRRRQMKAVGIIPEDADPVLAKREEVGPAGDEAARMASSPRVTMDLAQDMAVAAALAITGDPFAVGAEPVHLIDAVSPGDALKLHGPFKEGEYDVVPMEALEPNPPASGRACVPPAEWRPDTWAARSGLGTLQPVKEGGDGSKATPHLSDAASQTFATPPSSDAPSASTATPYLGGLPSPVQAYLTANPSAVLGGVPGLAAFLPDPLGMFASNNAAVHTPASVSFPRTPSPQYHDGGFQDLRSYPSPDIEALLRVTGPPDEATAAAMIAHHPSPPTSTLGGSAPALLSGSASPETLGLVPAQPGGILPVAVPAPAPPPPGEIELQAQDEAEVRLMVLQSIFADTNALMSCGLPDACVGSDMFGEASASVEDEAVWKAWNGHLAAKVPPTFGTN
ncbi:hypothetical protein HDU96_006732 [Phlyctochytrium bullatum]|nr:hypothetical protein HDU96_006732 [Phlyctochytrium bullatum]